MCIRDRALGARRDDVVKLFLQKGVVLASVGITAGVIVSASTASMMASLLYGVRPHDPVVFLVVPLLLLAVAVLASYIPARYALERQDWKQAARLAVRELSLIHISTLLRGRSFTEADEDGKPLVAVIDESTAHEFWPTQDPLGRRMRFRRDPTKPWTTVVGMVKDIKSDGLDIDGVPHIYVSTYQDSSKNLGLVLRTSLPAALLEPQIRHEIQSIDPDVPVFNISSMNDVLDRSLASHRFSADLVGAFAGLAVLLALSLIHISKASGTP